MPIEIDLKFKVDDHSVIRQRLQDAGAARTKETLETNIFFDTADRALRSTDRGLRIRRNRDVRSGSETLVVTYKGPRAAGPVKSREEIEMVVDDLSAAVAIFERIGYTQTLSFEKRRETWTLDQCTIELDQLPQLDTFVEIEGPTQEAVLKARNELNLTHVVMIAPSYAELVAQYLDKQDRRVSTLTFS